MEEASVLSGRYYQLRLITQPLDTIPPTIWLINNAVTVYGQFDVDKNRINTIILDIQSTYAPGWSLRWGILAPPSTIRIVQTSGLAERFGSLSGIVKASGAWVEAIPTEGKRAAATVMTIPSDEYGYFRLLLNPGTYTLTYTSAEGQTVVNDRPYTVLTGENTLTEDVTLSQNE